MKKPNTARPTVRDVANAAGVSKSLVSLAFKDPSKVSEVRLKKILEKSQELGYSPNFLAQSLAAEQAPFIGIMMIDLHNPLFSEIADSARKVFTDRGEHSLIMSATVPGKTASPGQYGEIDQQVMNMLRDLHPKGLLIIGSVADSSTLPSELPTVIASAFSTDLQHIPSVRSDDFVAMSLIFDHLIQQGHHSIAFAGGTNTSVAQARLKAYTQIAEDRGINPFIIKSGYSEYEGQQAGYQLLKLKARPTAVIAVNDLSALGLINVIEEKGLSVPDDLAVVGFDNTRLAKSPRISLTSVDTQNQKVGEESAKILLSLIDSPDSPHEDYLAAPELIIRKSSVTQ